MLERIPNIKMCAIGAVMLIACAIIAPAWAGESQLLSEKPAGAAPAKWPGWQRTNAIYQGYIRGEEQFFITLDVTFSDATGTFQYTDAGSSITLKGVVAVEDDVVLHGFVDDNTAGLFRCTISSRGETLTGVWLATDGPDGLPFSARRVAANVSEESWVEFDNFGASTTLTYPVFFNANYPWEETLTRKIMEEVQGAQSSFMIEVASRKNSNQFTKSSGYRIVMFSVGGFTPSYLSDKIVSMSYGIGVLAHFGYEMRGRHAINLLMLSDDETRALALADFVRGEEGLQNLSALVLADLERQYASSVTSGGITSLGEEDLSVFVVTPKGIRFYFNPKAVASYAEGTFEVFIPWAELGDLANMELLSE